MVQQQPSVTHLPSRLSTKLKDFIDNHGVNIDMSCMYTSSAMTLQRDPNKMVLVQYQALSRDEHMSYAKLFENEVSVGISEEALLVQPQAFESKSAFKNMQHVRPDESGPPPEPSSHSASANFDLPKSGPQFTLIEDLGQDKALRKVSSRQIQSEYSLFQFVFSEDQNRLAFTRKENGHFFVDIFDCSNHQKFFAYNGESAIPLSTEAKEFMGSIKFDQLLIDAPNMTFSDNGEYLSINGAKKLQIYQISNQLETERTSINDDHEDQQGVKMRCKAEFKLTNTTYSKIVCVYVNSENFDESWVVLSSDIFNTLHFVPLAGLLKSQMQEQGDENQSKLLQKKTKKEIKTQRIQENFNEQEVIEGFSGNLFKVQNEILVQINGLQEALKDLSLMVKFMVAGTHAVIQADKTVIMVGTDRHSKKDFKNLRKLPFSQNSQVDAFQFNSKSIVFCEKAFQGKDSYMRLSLFENEKSQKQIPDRIHTKADIQILEIIEIKQEGKEDMLRILGLCDEEELVMWQVSYNQPDKIDTKRFNRADLSAFSWPYFAYALGRNNIIIKDLSQSNCSFHLCLNQAEASASIENIQITSSQHLYVLMMSHRNMQVFQVNIQSDLKNYKLNQEGDENQNVTARLLRNTIVRLDKERDDSNLIDPEQINISNFSETTSGNIEQILKVPLTEGLRSQTEFKVIEKQQGLNTKVIFLSLQNSKLFLVDPIQEGHAKMSQILASVDQIQETSKLNTFYVLDKLKDEIRKVKIECNSGIFSAEQSLVFKENKAKIQKILSENDLLYVLMYLKPIHQLSVFKITPSLDLTPFSSLPLVKDQDFLTAFYQSSFISSGVLMFNSHKFYKIQKSFDGSKATILQEYTNYLPESTLKSRKLQHRQVKVSRDARKVGMTFTYKADLWPKKVSFMPFFSDNQIRLDQEINSQLSWISEGSGASQAQTTVFQFDPDSWLLSQSNLAGLKIKETSFQQSLGKYKILCVCPKKTLFLITQRGSEYLDKLKLVQITDGHRQRTVQEISLQKIEYIPARKSYFAKLLKSAKKSVYQVLLGHKVNFSCDVRFEINQNGDIVVVSVLPSGYLLQMFVILTNLEKKQDEAPRAYEVIVKVNQEEELRETRLRRQASSALEAQKQADLQSSMVSNQSQNVENKIQKQTLDQIPADNDESSQSNKNKELEERAYSLGYVTDFTISEHKLVLWNKHLIFHANINHKTVKDRNQVKLKMCQLQIARKAEGVILGREYLTAKQLLFQSSEVLQKSEGIKEKTYVDVDDYIDELHCRDIMITVQSRQYSSIQIKIVTSSHSAHILSYNLDLDREVTWLTASEESRLCFSATDECLVFDPNFGLIELHRKRMLLEYHLCERSEGPSDGNSLGSKVSWGNRMVQTSFGTFLVFDDEVLFPFSYLSILQHYRSQVQDRSTSHYFTEDFYCIEGRNTLHKHIYDPAQIERILDDYWRQNPLYILNVLVKEDLAEVQRSLLRQQSDQVTARGTIDKRESFVVRGGTELEQRNQDQLELKFNQFAKDQQIDQEVKFEDDEWMGRDILEVQIEISSDRLINKILFFLSRLPAQFSFFSTMPRFKELVKYSGFINYIDLWFEKTEQMEQTKVIFTNLTKGKHQIQNNCSYLDRKFFNDYPQTRLEQLPNYAAYKKFRTANLQQVSLRMMQISWITKNSDSLLFLDALCWSANQGHALELFDNENIRILVDYLWKISRPYFIIYRFLAYLILVYVPLIVLASTDIGDQGKVSPRTYYLQLACVIFIGIYVLWKFFQQFFDMCLLGCAGYFTSFNTMFELLNILIYALFLFYSAQFLVKELQTDVSEEHIKNTRVIFIGVILVANLQLFRFLKFFEFFASFVRSFVEVTKASIQIGTLLFFIVITMAMLIQILDANSFERTYVGVDGFVKAWVDSYKFSLGDFEAISNAFEDNTEYKWVFNVVFVLASVVTLLIILNMVIAVMSLALEKVKEMNEAYCYREKLIDIMANIHRFPNWIKRRFIANKYLIILEVDPKLDAMDIVESETEKQAQMRMLQERQDQFQADLFRIKDSLDNLHTRITQKITVNEEVQDSYFNRIKDLIY